jgi:hypothetical protein
MRNLAEYLCMRISGLGDKRAERKKEPWRGPPKELEPSGRAGPRTFALHLNLAALVNPVGGREELLRGLGHVYLHRLAGGLHPGGGVDRVAEEAVARHL